MADDVTRAAAAVLALLSALGAAPAAAPAQALARDDLAASCYDVSLGPWRPRSVRGADSIYIAPPSRVRFDTVPDRRSRDRFVLATAPGAVPSVHRFATWYLVGGDSVALAWSTGFSGLRMTLGGRPDELRGEAHAFWDFPTDPLTADAVARRVPCDAPVRSPPQRLVFRAVPLEGGDSVAIGSPLAALRAQADSVRGRSFRMRRRPAGPFAGAGAVEFAVDSRDTVWRVSVIYPPDTDFEAIVANLSRLLGAAVSRDTIRPPSSGDIASVLVMWSNRTTRLALYRGALTGGGWRISAMITDPRRGP